MRRLRLLLVLLAGLTWPLAGQARARVGAILESAPAGAVPNVRVHISDLLDDPEWRDALNNAYTLHLHWRVRIWRSRLLFDNPSDVAEWDDEIQQIPVVDVFTFRERTRASDSTIRFTSLDSLKQYVAAPATVRAPRNLDAGRWYYTVDVSISGEPSSRNGDADPGDLTTVVERFVLGRGPRRDLPTATTTSFQIRR